MMEEESQTAERTASPIEKAMSELSDEIESLARAIGKLEDRLSPVINMRVVDSVDPEGMKVSGPSGNSDLLSGLHGRTSALHHQSERINTIMARLDI